MLGIVFRGIFILSILYWYSTAVWKMIDGYFRDQFKSYLEDEYKKNPKMKTDVRVEGNRAEGESIIVESPPRESGVNSSNGGTGMTNATNETDVENDINEGGKGDGTLNEPRCELDDKNSPDTVAGESELRTGEREDENREGNNSVEGNEDESVGSNVVPLKSEEDLLKSMRAKYKDDKNSKDTAFNKNRVSKKRKRLAEKNRVSNDYDDFWEFEEDADARKESREGILISELPFKPKLDLADLERVSKDEYCPLSLDDEEPCEKLYKWP